MDLIGSLLKMVIDILTLPISLLIDIITLFGFLTGKGTTYIGDHIRAIGDDFLNLYQDIKNI